MTKEELKKQLAQIEEEEEAKQEEETKRANFKRFMERSPDYMVGFAHAELDFINKRYASDRSQAIMPSCVQVSGNCGKSYYPVADVTRATKTYFHNVWNQGQEREFQDELNALAYKYVTKYAFGLQQRLEMMGLQSLYYYISEEYFLAEDVPTVRAEVEKAQDAILDTYTDDDFRGIQKNRWHSENEDGSVTETVSLELSHSNHILRRYLTSHRPHLLNELFPEKN